MALTIIKMGHILKKIQTCLLFIFFAYPALAQEVVLLHLLGHLVKGNIEKSLTW